MSRYCQSEHSAKKQRIQITSLWRSRTMWYQFVSYNKQKTISW